MLQTRKGWLLFLVLLPLFAVSSSGFTPTSNKSQRRMQTLDEALANTRNVNPSRTLPKEVSTLSSISKNPLFASQMSNDEEKGFVWNFDPKFGALWTIFLLFAFVFSPGEFGAAIDNEILANYIADPVAPQGINEIFLVIFNSLGVMPIIMACLTFPQGSKEGLPAGPFVGASFGAGFFGLAPYLTFRANPVEQKTISEMSWFSKNVLENKVFSWLLVSVLLSLPFSTGLLAADSTEVVVSGFKDLASVSKFVSVSSVDLMILTVAAALLIPRDYELRSNGDNSGRGSIIAAATALFPVLGAALYCALRPRLPEE